jgi:hypothetical protein
MAFRPFLNCSESRTDGPGCVDDYYYVLRSSRGWCRYVCTRRTPPVPSKTNIQYQKAARTQIMPGRFLLGSTLRQKICPVQSTCTYLVPAKNHFFENHFFENPTWNHVGVMYVRYTLFLPMPPTTHQYTRHFRIIIATATPTITSNHGGLVSK